MSADASIDLELNAKPMYSELAVAERKFSQGMDNMGGKTGRLSGGLDGITVKTRAAGRQIHNFAQDMANGADAATLFQDGLMGVGKSLGLSLGSIAALGIGAVVVGKVHTMVKEYQALNNEIDKLVAPRAGADFQTLTALESHLTKTSEALQNLREQKEAVESAGWFGGALDMVRAMAGGKPNAGESMVDMVKRRRSDQISGLSDSADRDRGDMAEKFQHGMRDRQAALGGEPDFISKAKKFQREADEKSHATQEAVVELMQELEMSFRELAKSVAEKRRERVQRTLGEIAATPEVATAGMSYEDWQSGQKARSAQQWDAYGESRRQAGDMQGAQDAFNHSADIKTSIPGLKGSEQTKADMTGAINEAEILKEMLAAVKKPAVNR
jgi:hypothetical protein